MQISLALFLLLAGSCRNTDSESGGAGDSGAPAPPALETEGLELEISASATEVTADGRSVVDLQIAARVDGAPAPDGYTLPLEASLGEVISGLTDGGAVEVDLIASTWAGEATLSAGGAVVSGDTVIQMVRGETIGAQLHAHGSLSEGNASMAWHAAQADAHNVDLIWWTDHDISYHPDGAGELTGFDFESGGLSEAVPIYANRTNSVVWELWESDFSEVTSEVTAEAAYEGEFGWELEASGGETLRYVLTAQPDIHYKSLIGELSFSVWIRPRGDAGLILRIPLSASHASRDNRTDGYSQIVLYHLDEAPEPVDGAVYVPIEAEIGEWTQVSLDLSAFAEEHFPELNLDQHAELIDVELVGGDGRSLAYDLDGFSWPHALHGEQLMARQREYLETLDRYDVRHLVGQEISGFGVEHLNAFGADVPLLRYEAYSPGGTVEIAHHVHEHGGLLSFNHMFTTSGGLFDEAEIRERVEARIQEFSTTDVYRCDLLEVGYRERGGSMSHFLEVWDALGQVGIWITGIGTSDMHNRFEIANLANNFVTWVETASDSEEDLIWNLRRGAAWFGDPTRFPAGEVDVAFTAPAHRANMGQVVTGADGVEDVAFRASWLARGWQVRLIVNGEQVGDAVTVTEADAFAFEGEVEVGEIAVARVEVIALDGQPVLVTNPIYFLPPGSMLSAAVTDERRAPN